MIGFFSFKQLINILMIIKIFSKLLSFSKVLSDYFNININIHVKHFCKNKKIESVVSVVF